MFSVIYVYTTPAIDLNPHFLYKRISPHGNNGVFLRAEGRASFRTSRGDEGARIQSFGYPFDGHHPMIWVLKCYKMI